MQAENTVTEYKSFKKVTSGDAGFKDLSATCVCLANAQGGTIIIDIENKDKLPPVNQVITDDITNKTITRLRTLCFNVGMVLNEIETHTNGGQFFSIRILPTLKSVATTSGGFRTLS